MADNNKPVLVVLSGAGISAESGLKTFRDADGLWEGYNIEEVATFEGWKANPKLVLDFYNLRRKAANEAKPNLAHQILAELESIFEVIVITQNVDDLHERAGSKNILHLHGKLNESRSSVRPDLVYPILGDELNLGDYCEVGSQLRPNIVWFGEEVPAIPQAADLVATADVFLIIGTSLQVYPAAGLVNYFPTHKPLYIIDPKPMPYIRNSQLRHIQKTAIEGMKELKEILNLPHGS
jgi:NAD-dependent deacetylase